MASKLPTVRRIAHSRKFLEALIEALGLGKGQHITSIQINASFDRPVEAIVQHRILDEDGVNETAQAVAETVSRYVLMERDERSPDEPR